MCVCVCGKGGWELGVVVCGVDSQDNVVKAGEEQRAPVRPHGVRFTRTLRLVTSSRSTCSRQSGSLSLCSHAALHLLRGSLPLPSLTCPTSAGPHSALPPTSSLASVQRRGCIMPMYDDSLAKELFISHRFADFRFRAALRPQKPYGLPGIGSPGRPPRLSQAPELLSFADR